ncbi:hypothetical protein AX17_004195 [Amanita inopinata Kibby_2008]|nr:hypothetical protein AX17_004195 [Amanita inopinata Kibby_2008]
MSTVPERLNLTGLCTKLEEFPVKYGQYSDLFPGSLKARGTQSTTHVAIKVLRGGRTDDEVAQTELKEKLVGHGQRWQEFDHPNVAKFYGLAFDQGLMPALILDYYHKGGILQYLNDNSVSTQERLVLVRDIAAGLDYLHTLNPPIVHGDIRGANIFVHDGPRAVISDYELVMIINAQEFTSYKPAGAARWIAPELTTSADDEDYGGPKYSLQSDVFAFAMTAIEVFTGQVPFASRKQDLAVLRLICNGKRPDIPEEMQKYPTLSKLVETCWDADPLTRPPSNELIETLNSIMEPPAQSYSFWGLPNFLGRFFAGMIGL